MLEVTEDLAIDESLLEERFVRASGPGGQNVNKVATAVELRFDPAACPQLTAPVRQRLRVLAGSRMTTDGTIVIDARRFRTQVQNREDARDRLAALVRQALVAPRQRRKTRPTRSAVEKRIDSKKRRATTKHRRTNVPTDD